MQKRGLLPYREQLSIYEYRYVGLALIPSTNQATTWNTCITWQMPV
ncbi:hypothetical protein JYQ62_24190 [Nostoc sp. UHCC 0702]|nr:hypothetical protein JYQ62_24190 [Nostoc sp. UHCC 0702]